MKRPRINALQAVNVLGVGLFVAVLGMMIFLMLQVSGTQKVISELSVNNNQLRDQLLEENIDPIAPPAEAITEGAGPTGATGSNGRDGKDGKDGEPGPPGEPGPAGPPGANGLNGTDGVDGVDGGDGATGPTGPTGAPGATGATGPAGPPGAAGTDGRGVATLECQPDGSWLVVYTDSSTSTTPGPCRIFIDPVTE